MAYGFHVHPKEYTADVRGFSFVIERDGDVYKAYRSGKGLTFEDDDASEVIQSAVDNIYPNGVVFLKCGEYLLNSPIDAKFVTLIGEGGKLRDYGARLIANRSMDYMIKCDYEYQQIRNLALDGNGLAKHGLYAVRDATASLNVLVERVFIGGTTDYEIYFDNIDGSMIEKVRCSGAKGVYYNAGAGTATLKFVRLTAGASRHFALSGQVVDLDNCAGCGIRIGTSTRPTLNLLRTHSCYLWSNPDTLDILRIEGCLHRYIDENSLFILEHDGDHLIRSETAEAYPLLGGALFLNSYIYIMVSAGDVYLVDDYITGTLKNVAEVQFINCKLQSKGATINYETTRNEAFIYLDGTRDVGLSYYYKDVYIGSKKKKNSGIATFSGDGSTTEFKIEHGLVSAPSKYVVSPLTPDAHADKTISVDDTYIIITFSTAPPSGTDNLKFSWWAEV